MKRLKAERKAINGLLPQWVFVADRRPGKVGTSLPFMSCTEGFTCHSTCHYLNKEKKKLPIKCHFAQMSQNLWLKV